MEGAYFMSRGKVSPEEKIKAVKLYLNGKSSIRQMARMYGVYKSSIQAWVRNYESMGVEAFNSKKNKQYTAEVKQEAVREYLSGRGSLPAVCKKYGIRSAKQLRDWLKVYSRHGTLKSSGTGRSAFMTKSRETTFDERIEIVRYCIEHDDNYAETAEKYGISYQQARSYTLKYKERGVEALVDRRGKRKDISEMTEEERLRAENKLLKAKLRRSEIEVLYLKKLKEIERRRD